jgi:predicted esterase
MIDRRAFLLLVGMAAAAAETAPREKFLGAIGQDEATGLAIAARAGVARATAAGRMTPALNQLAAEATRAYAAHDYNAGFVAATRLLLKLEGFENSEALDVAGAYDVKLNRVLYGLGEYIEVTLDPLYAPVEPLSGAYTARISLLDAQGATVSAAPPVAIDAVTAKQVTLPRRGLKPGEYRVHYTLSGANEEAIVAADRVFVVSENVDARVRKIRERMAGLKPGDAAARLAMAESVEYIADGLDRARREYYASQARKLRPIIGKLTLFDPNTLYSEPFDVEHDLTQAEAMLDALEAGQKFFDRWKGTLRMAYRSPLDNTLQPYRLFVPKNYAPDTKMPLIVALHGATCDNNLYIDRLRDASGSPSFPKFAEERGYLIASPEGRGPFGGYVNKSEQDVLDVLHRVKALYNTGSVFLTGHSMGGGGTWFIGFHHAEEFAALAPVAGGPKLDSIAFDQASAMPVFFVWAEKDELVPVTAMRTAAATAGKTLKNLKTFESPGDDHLGVAVSSVTRVFDFFDQMRRSN